RYLNSYKTWALPQPPNFGEADVSDKPAWVQAFPAFKKKNVNTIKSGEITRLRMLAAVDDLVAKVMNEIQAQGVSGTTDIIFTSDNGFMPGEHRIPTGKEPNYAPRLDVPSS